MVRVRRFLKSDTQACIRLFRETIHAINIRDYTQAQVDVWAPATLDRARWEQLAERRTFVADDDGVVVGFAELEESGHVDRFYVHKDHQGVGIGTLLMNAVEAEARGLGVALLFAEVSITAKPFFLRRGFVVIAQQTVHVRGTDFVNFRMQKPLRLP